MVSSSSYGWYRVRVSRRWSMIGDKFFFCPIFCHTSMIRLQQSSWDGFVIIATIEVCQLSNYCWFIAKILYNCVNKNKHIIRYLKCMQWQTYSDHGRGRSSKKSTTLSRWWDASRQTICTDALKAIWPCVSFAVFVNRHVNTSSTCSTYTVSVTKLEHLPSNDIFIHQVTSNKTIYTHNYSRCVQLQSALDFWSGSEEIPFMGLTWSVLVTWHQSWCTQIVYCLNYLTVADCCTKGVKNAAKINT